MAPGESSNCRDCDDCGYQECLKLGVCLNAHAHLLGVEAADLANAGPIFLVRLISSDDQDNRSEGARHE
ncbi:hypothetical protein CD944_04900 [Brevundimonas diminuta]|jgi:hypothetical protein|nr:hypothetical protein CD944_04900 [Brevundimonas diminuta]